MSCLQCSEGKILSTHFRKQYHYVYIASFRHFVKNKAIPNVTSFLKKPLYYIGTMPRIIHCSSTKKKQNYYSRSFFLPKEHIGEL